MRKTLTPKRFLSDKTCDIIELCARFIDHYDLFTEKSTVIIGLSGGPDSVFLLHLLASLRPQRSLQLIAAHLDHGWRQQSEKDVIFCREIAARYETLFVQGHARDYPVDEGSLEAQGRTSRRLFFDHILQEHHAQNIALGHHADDQIETFFIRLLRGAGVTGLAGIMPRNGIYVHPLLPITKQSIITFLNKHELPFLTDSTNSDPRFLRNRIRTDVIPTLIKTDDRAVSSITRSMDLLQQTNDYLLHETNHYLQNICTLRDEKSWLDIKKLREVHPFMQNQIVLAWFIQAQVPFTPSQDLITEAIRFLYNTKSVAHTFYHSWRIIKKQWYACIEK